MDELRQKLREAPEYKELELLEGEERRQTIRRSRDISNQLTFMRELEQSPSNS
jgi:hypothetical protein